MERLEVRAMQSRRAVAGAMIALLLAGCGGRVKAPGVVSWPATYQPADNAINPSAMPSASPSVAPTPKGKGKVQGTVLDISGRPLGNVKVTVDGTTTLTASTDATGTFRLADVPAGWQFMTFNYEGQTFPGSMNVVAETETTMPPVTYDNRYNGFGNQPNGWFDLPTKSMLHTWRMTGVSAWSGIVYATVVDNDGTLKGGSVLRLDTRKDKTWSDIGDNLFGLLHPLKETAAGVAMGPDKLYVVDGKAGLFALDPQKGGPRRVSKTGMTDVTVGGGKIFVKTDTGVQTTDDALGDFSTVPGLTASGGIGADPTGVVFAVDGKTVKRFNGKSEAVITGLSNPIDVAADRQGFVYVLEPTNVKRFGQDGKIVGVFPIQAQVPVSIACDESGAVYVADQARAPRPSRVWRYTAASKPGTPQPSPSPYGYGYTGDTGTDWGSDYGGVYSGDGTSGGSYGSY
jgi:hypothetical protein